MFKFPLYCIPLLHIFRKYFQAKNIWAELIPLTKNTSVVQSLNIKRTDPRVTHELFTFKLSASKPQQSGAFVIEHLKKKSATLPKKNRCSIPKRVRIANKWKENHSWLLPKATDILQNGRRVCPTIFSEVQRMLRSPQYMGVTKTKTYENEHLRPKTRS